MRSELNDWLSNSLLTWRACCSNLNSIHYWDWLFIFYHRKNLASRAQIKKSGFPSSAIPNGLFGFIAIKRYFVELRCVCVSGEREQSQVGRPEVHKRQCAHCAQWVCVSSSAPCVRPKKVQASRRFVFRDRIKEHNSHPHAHHPIQ